MLGFPRGSRDMVLMSTKQRLTRSLCLTVVFIGLIAMFDRILVFWKGKNL